MTASERSTVDGHTWQIAGWTPEQPFTARLEIGDEHGADCTIHLDPVLVRDLGGALADLHAAQRAALGAPEPATLASDYSPPAANAPAYLDDEPPGSPEPSEPNDEPPTGSPAAWWRRHIGLAILLGIVAVCFLISLIRSATLT